MIASDLAENLVDLGIALRKEGKVSEAALCCKKALLVRPDYLKGYLHLGDALHALERYAEAVTCYEQALALKPDFAEAHNNRGNALLELGRYEEAICGYREALRLMPHYAEAHVTIGTAMQAMGKPVEAAACYRHALDINPDCGEAHWNLALVLLLLGDYGEGWQEYEWRWKKKQFTSPRRNFMQPEWDGSDPSGRAILLHAEQGFGDTIQFVRYAPLVAERGGRVIVECHPALKSLLAKVAGVEQVVSLGDPLPAFDCHLPLMSLPLVFGTTVDTIPADVPYVTPPEDQMKRWSKKLAHDDTFKVGLVWAGRAYPDRNRSCPFENFATLAGMPGTTFYTLQMGEEAAQAGTLPQGLCMADLTGEIGDFADTAALIAGLDLVISIDTAVAHLAGSMGKPVWVLLPFAPDWRWFLGRCDTPWYPSMRLFRQGKPGDWGNVLVNVRHALQGFAAEFYNNRGCSLDGEGMPDDAEHMFNTALALHPLYAEAHNNLGALLGGRGRHKEALGRYRKAISLKPEFAHAFYNMGNACNKLGRPDESLECYRQALKFAPHIAEIHHNLGLLLQSQGKTGEATASVQQALALKPDYPEALYSLGELYHSREMLAEAETCYEKVLGVEPDHVDSWNALGTVLQMQDRMDEAVACYRKALALQHDCVDALNNLGAALEGQGMYGEAAESYRRAISFVPDLAEAHWNLSLVQLLQGNFLDGFAGYQWRWRKKNPVRKREFSKPIWDGSGLNGRTVLLYGEQGFGDTFQLVRYVPLVAGRGGRVVVECQTAALKPVIERVAGVAAVVAQGEALPEFDVHYPLASLPFLFGTTLETIPALVPYVTPSPDLTKTWRQRIGADRSCKVGLVWKGRQSQVLNRKRSCRLETFAPLASLPGLTFYSLQLGDGAEEAGNPPQGMELADLTGDIGDFADTAAFIAGLDLIISIDTAVAHLAGAMGKPVWVLLPFAPDWRWLLDRDDSPWYPSMRLFRQEKSGDWQGVMIRVKEALAELVASAANAGLIPHPAGEGQTLPESDTDADAFNLLGIEAFKAGNYEKAAEMFSRAISANGHTSSFHNNLGIAFKELGRPDEAADCFRTALDINPVYPMAHYNLGIVLQNKGDFDGAVQCYQKALQLNPDYMEALNNQGNALQQLGRLDEAVQAYRQALAFNPAFFDASMSLGNALKEQGMLDAAVDSYHKALELKPDSHEAYNNLGNALKAKANPEAAIEACRKALQLKLDYQPSHSNLLFALHYSPKYEPMEIFAEHLRWARIQAEPLMNIAVSHPNSPILDRTLRVGYVSPDFRIHPVAFFIEPALAAHDHERFTVFCYSDVMSPDIFTRQLQNLPGQWRTIAGLSDEAAAEVIRRDKIDILVDLAGHTANNRMLMFARKPAPVQITWLGYPDTTGLAAMDYRITDAKADPPGLTEQLHTEQLLRLPATFLCYRPAQNAPDVGPLPSGESGHITFASFNNFAKVTPQAIALWARILLAVPGSRLMLKSLGLGEEVMQRRVQEMFASRGVTPDRLEMQGNNLSYLDHLDLYNRVDIALDTFPYNGTTTTCEALWMGTPVIALRGKTHVSRVGVSLLSTAGCGELIAETPEEYLETAVRLAHDREWLRTLREGLRGRLTRSPLTDVEGFTRSLEEAYRHVWQIWCEKSAAEEQVGADDSDFQETCYNLGNALKDHGRMDEAIECYRRALESEPGFYLARNNLGNALKEQGLLDEAVECFRKALETEPAYYPAHHNLGLALKEKGELDAAIGCFHSALEIKPDYANAYNGLGAVLKIQADIIGSIEYYRKALELNPVFFDAHIGLGNALRDAGELEAAIDAYRTALDVDNESHDVWNNLGVALKESGRPGRAVECLQKALALKPDSHEAYNNIGITLQAQARPDAAIDAYRRALELNPDYRSCHGNLLFAMHYSSTYTPREIFAEHLTWAKRHAEPLMAASFSCPNAPVPDRPLRVGYVSPDFKIHPVAFFIQPALAAHNHERFMVFCYSDAIVPDSFTEQLKKLPDQWRTIAGVSDEESAEVIRKDGIDILVDLAGHTANNRMLMFARKPAPIQISWLGYPDTTGLAAVDYRITDAKADPPGLTEQFHTEQLLRLPATFLCYRPAQNAPDVGPLPAGLTGPVTFASFNNFAKVTPEAIALWARILLAVPGSRLMLKSLGLGEESMQKHVQETFASHGVAPGRLEMQGNTLSYLGHLDLYNRVDIALDTFPYNGTTTTCEALWMGVPVITLRGKTHVSRVGVSLLSTAGCGELIAETPEEYLETAVRLAHDREGLRTLREGLRGRLTRSPLTDAEGFTRSLEGAYRYVWQIWCEKC
ncbi:MAG: hypothetical protein FD174_2078 [Geobacteraceae bacterium]|nr:MAG: hypothetical protein FD174_2078 [Geobacteraceae bacterium]